MIYNKINIGDKIIIQGRGFGHGVGLCQEGAISMVKKGYAHKETLHYYYDNVNIININKMDFYLLF